MAKATHFLIFYLAEAVTIVNNHPDGNSNERLQLSSSQLESLEVVLTRFCLFMTLIPFLRKKCPQKLASSLVENGAIFVCAIRK